jgi:hypothetical protein
MLWGPNLLLLTQWLDLESTYKGLVIVSELVCQVFKKWLLTRLRNYPKVNVSLDCCAKWRQFEVTEKRHIFVRCTHG